MSGAARYRAFAGFVVGPPAVTGQVEHALDRAAPGAFRFRGYPSQASATTGIAQRQVDGALVASGPSLRLLVTQAGGTGPEQALNGAFTAVAARSGRRLVVSDVVPPRASDTQALSSWFVVLSVLIPSLAAGSASAIAFRRAPRPWSVAAPTAVLARIWPPLTALAVLVFIVLGIPVSGGPANLASFTPGFLRVLSPVLPLGIAASSIRDVVYFGGHAAGSYLWTLAAWALAGVAGLILVTTLRRRSSALTVPPLVLPEPVSAPDPRAARPVTLVIGFDDSEPARRALIWGADLVRARPGALHVVYADHVLVDSDLTGFAHAEMEESRDEKGTRVAEAAAEIAAAAGVPYTFGRSHHAAHHVIGSVPVHLLNHSPYPVLTIT